MVKRGKIAGDKRGLEMAFSTVVVMVIAIILLILLITFLTGGFSKFKEKIDVYLGSSNVDLIIEQCNTLVTQDIAYDYCCAKKIVKVSSKETLEISCQNASGRSWGENIEELNCEGVC